MIFRVFILVMHYTGRFTAKHELARASGCGGKTRKNIFLLPSHFPSLSLAAKLFTEVAL